jgi:hypothetical protein
MVSRKPLIPISDTYFTPDRSTSTSSGSRKKVGFNNAISRGKKAGRRTFAREIAVLEALIDSFHKMVKTAHHLYRRRNKFG